MKLYAYQPEAMKVQPLFSHPQYDAEDLTVENFCRISIDTEYTEFTDVDATGYVRETIFPSIVIEVYSGRRRNLLYSLVFEKSPDNNTAIIGPQSSLDNPCIVEFWDTFHSRTFDNIEVDYRYACCFYHEASAGSLHYPGHGEAENLPKSSLNKNHYFFYICTSHFEWPAHWYVVRTSTLPRIIANY